jgi:hypothetical protein
VRLVLLETPTEIRNQKSEIEIGPEAATTTTTTQQEIPAEILEGTPTNPQGGGGEPGSGFQISDFRFQISDFWGYK